MSTLPPDARVIRIVGPNHALHFVATLCTCGLWAMVWLIVAIVNTRRVEYVNAYGVVVTAPLAPNQPLTRQ